MSDNKDRNAKQRERYHSDPEYREQKLRRSREYRRTQGYRPKDREYQRKRYSDPAKREARREYQRQWYATTRAKKLEQAIAQAQAKAPAPVTITPAPDQRKPLNPTATSATPCQQQPKATPRTQEKKTKKARPGYAICTDCGRELPARLVPGSRCPDCAKLRHNVGNRVRRQWDNAGMDRVRYAARYRADIQRQYEEALHDEHLKRQMAIAKEIAQSDDSRLIARRPVEEAPAKAAPVMLAPELTPRIHLPHRPCNCEFYPCFAGIETIETIEDVKCHGYKPKTKKCK